MYVGIDLGGTKTLIALFDKEGNRLKEIKFQTNSDYGLFISELEKNVAEISTDKFEYCALAIPGRINRSTGVAYSLGNLDWKNVPIRDDVSRILGNIDVIIENDAKVAGLSEASRLPDYKKVVYITVSTGIGVAFVVDGSIPKYVEDIEMGKMPLRYDGELIAWEDFASGRAIKSRYNMQASEIQDPNTWREIGERVAYGTAIVCSAFQPEVIVFGGGAGKYADNFIDTVDGYLRENLHSNVVPPKKMVPAFYPDDSVIRGCFVLMKQKGAIK